MDSGDVVALQGRHGAIRAGNRRFDQLAKEAGLAASRRSHRIDGGLGTRRYLGQRGPYIAAESTVPLPAHR
jgi:hypothetical protein